MNELDVEAPVIAVIMAVFNGEKWLEKAIESVLLQHYANFEFFVVDDGSTDSTSWIIQKYMEKDKRIKLLSNASNEGVIRSRNRAILCASPSVEYVAILDSDDIATVDRLQKQIDYFSYHPDVVLIGSHVRIIDESDTVIGFRNYPTSYADICKVITRYNPFTHSAMMVRRIIFSELGLYDESCIRCEDYDFLLRVAAIYPVTNLAHYLVDYRISSEQMKHKNLKETLLFTQKIQARWLLERRFFSLVNQSVFVFRFLLFLLPNNFCLWLFKKISYRK